MSKRKRFNESEKRIKEERGSEYNPWIRVQDVHSKGSATISIF